MAFTTLNRGVLKISGDDKASFLQGIVTQDIRAVSPDKFLYGCFLTPQGKYLVDFFITQRDDYFLLDVDASLTADFIKRLSMYKLRSKVVIEDVSEQLFVTAFWGSDAEGLPDPRFSGLGTRFLSPKLGAGTAPGDYTLHLMQNGIPATADFERERTGMLEANMDLLNALSWDKGCYMGQELTARTHYRGLVKKRFLPLKFVSDVSLEKDTPVKQDDKTIGFIRRSHKNYALAVLQLEAAEQNHTVNVADQNAEIIFPEWFTQP